MLVSRRNVYSIDTVTVQTQPEHYAAKVATIE